MVHFLNEMFHFSREDLHAGLDVAHLGDDEGPAMIGSREMADGQAREFREVMQAVGGADLAIEHVLLVRDAEVNHLVSFGDHGRGQRGVTAALVELRLAGLRTSYRHFFTNYASLFERAGQGGRHGPDVYNASVVLSATNEGGDSNAAHKSRAVAIAPCFRFPENLNSKIQSKRSSYVGQEYSQEL